MTRKTLSADFSAILLVSTKISMKPSQFWGATLEMQSALPQDA